MAEESAARAESLDRLESPESARRTAKSSWIGAAEDAPSSSATAKRIRSDKSGEVARRFFAVPDGEMPLLVFVNPKSGGKQGEKLLGKFRRILSDTQVYDMMERDSTTNKVVGARKGLLAHGKVKNLSVLVCGGDGTVGWVLSTLDELELLGAGIRVGTIPLGTGNDLARALKFGAGYSGESVLRMLAPLADCGTIQMDRWEIDCTEVNASLRKKNYNIGISEKPPQKMWNNYFSIGSDAHTALQFHLRREKNPKKYNSQWRNKMTYGIVGGFETLNSKFKNLSRELEVVCDGVDYTEKIREKKIVALAFLNIHSYGAGTQPWGTKKAKDNKGFTKPSMDDGRLEVVGFWPWSFPKGQAGVGHAWRICQCSQADIKLLSPNPMQIDGEPCFLAASKIRIRHRSQASMLCHRHGRYRGLAPALSTGANSPDELVPQHCLVYEVKVDEKSMTASNLTSLGYITGDASAELDTYPLSRVRDIIIRSLTDFKTSIKSDEFSFLKFDRSSGGRYVAIDVMTESTILCRGFMFPSSGIRQGIFITKRMTGIDDGNPTGITAAKLFQAITAGDWKQTIELLDSGIPPTVMDSDGDSLIHIAAGQNQLELLTYLLAHGVDCKRRNKLGNTPLHVAATRGCTVAANLLLEADADIIAKNDHGKTPLDLATSEAMQQLLQDHMELPADSVSTPTINISHNSEGSRVSASPAKSDVLDNLLNTSQV